MPLIRPNEPPDARPESPWRQSLGSYKAPIAALVLLVR